MIDIPKWASSHLDQKHSQTIIDSVAEAESKTSGEIVPMIVRRSSTVGHIPIIVLSILSIIYLLLDLSTLQSEFFGEQWLWLIYVANMALLLFLSSSISRIHFVQRRLTS